MSKKPLRIALLGSRGIPACYGGYETLMEELSWRLVELGADVTVYCRSQYTPRSLSEHRGVRLVVLPTIRSKHLDTPVHTLLSCLDAAFRRFDVALVVNGANAIFVPLLRAAGVATALHVDGLEQEREKWGALGRTVYRVSERLAVWLPSRLVTDAAVIERRYRERYRAESTMIPYGVDPQPLKAGARLESLGLESRRYFLYVSRFEPENNPHRVVDAYRDVGGKLPLVMVGDAPYAQRFVDQMRKSADSRVLFPGAIYGDGYRELLSHALAYVHATSVGGTHPALVEAMGYGNCVLVNDTPENREVAGDAGVYFSVATKQTLSAPLSRLAESPAEAEPWRRSAAERARARYSWPAVVERYRELFEDLARA